MSVRSAVYHRGTGNSARPDNFLKPEFIKKQPAKMQVVNEFGESYLCGLYHTPLVC